MIKKILKGSAVIFSFKICAAGSNFLTNILIPRMFSIEAMGAYNLIIALEAFLSIFSIMGLDLYSIRKLSETKNSKEKSYSYIYNVLSIVTLLSMLIGLVILINRAFIGTVLKWTMTNEVLIVLPLIILFYSLLLTISAIFRGLGDLFRYSIFQNFGIQFGMFNVLLFIFLFESYKVNVVYVYSGVVFFVCISGILELTRYLRSRFGPLIKLNFSSIFSIRILFNSYPMMITSSAIFVMGYSSSLLVSHYCGLYQVGIYSAIQKLTLPTTFFATAISGYIGPEIARRYSAGEYLKIKSIYYNAIKLLLMTGLPVLAIILIIPDFLLQIFGKEFIVGSQTLRIYAFGTFLGVALFGPIGYFMVMTGRQIQFQWIIIFALIANIVLSILLIPIYGIAGAATATLVATILWKGIGYLFLKRASIL